jgi:hypothetical protein
MIKDLPGMRANITVDLDEYMKFIFSRIHTLDNISVGSGKTYISKAWDTSVSVSGQRVLTEIAQRVVDKMKGDHRLSAAYKVLQNHRETPEIDYVTQYGYSPESTADLLEQMYQETPLDEICEFSLRGKK